MKEDGTFDDPHPDECASSVVDSAVVDTRQMRGITIHKRDIFTSFLGPVFPPVFCTLPTLLILESRTLGNIALR